MDGPDDVDAAFAEIVAGLARDGVAPDWPAEHDEPNEPPAGHTPTATALSGRPSGSELDSLTGECPQPSEALTGPDQPAKSTRGPDQPRSEDEHFVPPPPPPLPRLRRGTVLGLALLLLGLLLLVAPGLLGLTSTIGTPLALIAVTGGIGWLVLRMRQGPPPDSGWDDGAQL
jgi:hypothetical protein